MTSLLGLSKILVYHFTNGARQAEEAEMVSPNSQVPGLFICFEIRLLLRCISAIFGWPAIAFFSFLVGHVITGLMMATGHQAHEGNLSNMATDLVA